MCWQIERAGLLKYRTESDYVISLSEKHIERQLSVIEYFSQKKLLLMYCHILQSVSIMDSENDSDLYINSFIYENMRIIHDAI